VSYLHFVLVAVIVVDVVLCAVVIRWRGYTEIDWLTYMQQVSGFVRDGERDYYRLEGDTGPLVYPAGFLFVYTALHAITEGGSNIRLGQVIFGVLHVLTIAVVVLIYAAFYGIPKGSKGGGVIRWAWVLPLMLSIRVMSIYVLRLFNDAVEALLVYGSVLLFAQNRWAVGCLVYSLAVSVKMNALLYAPGILLLLLEALGVKKAALHIVGICGGVQLVLGLPFLISYPWHYITRAFEFSRVFTHKWSVNFAFLTDSMFTSKLLAVALLVCHLAMLVQFALHRWIPSLPSRPSSAAMWWRRLILARNHTMQEIPPDRVVLILLTCNFIGVTFARTLHYQFYAWYFHALPLLVTVITGSWVLRALLLLGIEVVFNTYPPRPWASLLLHLCHGTILLGLYRSSPRQQPH